MKIEEKKRKKNIITKRKKTIIELIAKGYQAEEIAEKIKFSVSVVYADLNTLFKDTETQNRAHLVAWAYQNNIL